MALPASLTTVTRLSKRLALILFIALPFLGFLFGMKWQEMLDSQNQQATTFEHVAPHPTPTITEASQDESADITAKDNGKTFSYIVTQRFSVELDKNLYPISSLKCNPDGTIGQVSNLSINGPDNYPIGFQALKPGTCILKNGDFSVTIRVK